jgi:hypothetical protein
MFGFFSFLGSVFSSVGGFLKTGLGQILLTLGLDVASALLNGGGNSHGERLKNKSIATSTYGRPIPRCRGTVRIPGQLIWWSGIVETTHKRSSGGFFGIGGSSVYTYTYSASCAFAFGKKLGGGAAVRVIRIWADGKLLFSALQSDATLTGSATIVGTAPAGLQAVPIQISGGGSLKVSTGDLITFSSDPATEYEVQLDLNLGSGQTGFVTVFPPLASSLTGDTIAIPAMAGPWVDNSSFDPDPHDGSHVVAGFVPPGTLRFHLGSSGELPDPAFITALGAGQSPGYRGLPYVMLENLELANYGQHVPSITAEIAYDVDTGHFPLAGPLTAALQTVDDTFAVPAVIRPTSIPDTSAPLAISVKGSVSGSPDLEPAYVIDTQSNSIVLTANVLMPWQKCMAIDTDGFLYIGSTTGTLGVFAIYKYNVSDLSQVNFDVTIGDPSSIFCYDVVATFLGNPVLLKLLIVEKSFGGFDVMDRVQDTSTLGNSYISSFHDPDVAIDRNADFWVGEGSNIAGSLTQLDGSFHTIATIDPITLSVGFALAGPVLTVKATYDITADLTNDVSAVFYDPGTHSVTVLDFSGKLCRYDCATGTLLGTQQLSGVGSYHAQRSRDVLGNVLIGTNGIFRKVALWSITGTDQAQVTSYDLANWYPSYTYNGGEIWDPATNSIWTGVTSGTGVARFYLDRGEGNGLGLDDIVASIFAEAGYSSGEYDVSALAPITTQGYEIDQEPFLDSIKKLQSLFLFDMAEIDGKIVCVPRDSGLGAITIPESDLGATDIGTAPAPRASEVLTQETDVPETVWVHYYDITKALQQAAQYDKRISQPAATSLASNPKVTNSRNQLSVSVPVTDSPGPMKLQARRILLDNWQARMKYTFKTSWKYLRLDPTDKIQLTYKGQTLDVRLTSIDRGAGMALEFQGESYDAGIYSVPAAQLAAPSNQRRMLSQVPAVNPTSANNNYAISPAAPLSQTDATTIALATTKLTRTGYAAITYNARTFTIADPGLGNTQLYFVTIYDPAFTGDTGALTDLTAIIDTTEAGAHVNEAGYIFLGSVLATHTGAGTETVAPGGGEVLGGTAPHYAAFRIAVTSPNPGDFTIAHNLGRVPTTIELVLTSDGIVRFQPTMWDDTNVYLSASDTGLTCILIIQ